MKSFFAEVKIFIFRPKTMDYSPWFDFLESKKSFEIRIPLERASQVEQNDTNLSSAAPSSEKLWSVQTFWLSTAVTTFTTRVSSMYVYSPCMWKCLMPFLRNHAAEHNEIWCGCSSQ